MFLTPLLGSEPVSAEKVIHEKSHFVVMALFMLGMFHIVVVVLVQDVVTGTVITASAIASDDVKFQEWVKSDPGHQKVCEQVRAEPFSPYLTIEANDDEEDAYETVW